MKLFKLWLKQLFAYILAAIVVIVATLMIPLGARSALYSSTYLTGRLALALIAGLIIIIGGTISFFIFYARVQRKHPKTEISSQMIQEQQMLFLQNVSQFSRRHFFAIGFAVILLALAVAMIDSFFG